MPAPNEERAAAPVPNMLCPGIISRPEDVVPNDRENIEIINEPRGTLSARRSTVGRSLNSRPSMLAYTSRTFEMASQYTHGYTYDVFVSYSSRDAKWVKNFLSDLVGDINRFADHDVLPFLDVVGNQAHVSHEHQ